MANLGRPNTNNTQFFISTIDCHHLDGENVVFGHVRKGLPIVSSFEQFATEEGLPTRDLIIADCGEIKPNEDWGYCDNDGTSDKLPPFPVDWLDYERKFSLNEKLEILEKIKDAGNYFYKMNDFGRSARKYRKLMRYCNHFKDDTRDSEELKTLDEFQLVNLTNLAATDLKQNDFEDVIYSCNAAIKINPINTKAYYRRGIANLELKNYEMALEDLKMALSILPNNKAIMKEFERARKHLMDYREIEKVHYKKMFQ
jgi:peptidyl-prolyl isomerase D